MIFDLSAVVRVPFPFTDRNATKSHPALVLSDANTFNTFNTPAGHSLRAVIAEEANSPRPLGCGTATWQRQVCLRQT